VEYKEGHAMTPNEQLMIEELNTLGFHHSNINEIHQEEAVQPLMVEVILKWLPAIYHDHVGSGEHLIRALISAVEPFDPTIIIQLFETSSYNSSIKWTMAYVLAISKTHDISAYIKKQLLEQEGTFERAGFLYGLTKNAQIQSRAELVDILRQLFDKYCIFGTYQLLFKKYASVDDIPFLEERLRNPHLTDFISNLRAVHGLLDSKEAKTAPKRFEREVTKMIEGIRKRKREHKFRCYR
jgi:hypothetical protein